MYVVAVNPHLRHDGVRTEVLWELRAYRNISSSLRDHGKALVRTNDSGRHRCHGQQQQQTTRFCVVCFAALRGCRVSIVFWWDKFIYWLSIDISQLCRICYVFRLWLLLRRNGGTLNCLTTPQILKCMPVLYGLSISSRRGSSVVQT